MPSPYITQRQKAIEFIDGRILPIIFKRDLSYEKVLSYIELEIKISPKIIAGVLDNYINLNKIKRIGDVLTIPDDKIVDYLKETFDPEREADAILKEVNNETLNKQTE